MNNVDQTIIENVIVGFGYAQIKYVILVIIKLCL